MANILLKTPADIGALIKDRRHTLQLKQEDLARRIGVSRLWVNQIAHGKPRASLVLILRTLDALGVTLICSASEKADSHVVSGTISIITPDINAIVADARRKDRL
jgi:HTH-type transcriptional regulator/antitoxin HipB